MISDTGEQLSHHGGVATYQVPVPYMTMYSTPPEIVLWVYITLGGILWVCRIHRTSDDKVGGRLGFQIIHQSRVAYSSGVITRGCDNKGV